MRASLVIRRLKICFPMQVMWVQLLVRDLRHHMQHGNEVCELQVLSWSTLEPVICKKRSVCATPRETPPCTAVRTQFNSVAQSCPTLCNPMECSKPGLPVHRQLLEFTQIRVH